MLQRYDISMDDKADMLSIEEFSAVGRTPRSHDQAPLQKIKYTSVYKATYDGDIIRAAIKKGKDALISELVSDSFFPIRSCAELIADKVIVVFTEDSYPVTELFFDDKALLLTDDEIE